MKPDFQLPAAAVESLHDSDLVFHLHCIPFSHYCERGRWYLRLAGIHYKRFDYLPMAHLSPMMKLLKHFKHKPNARTKYTGSPLATPCLAIYDKYGAPVW